MIINFGHIEIPLVSGYILDIENITTTTTTTNPQPQTSIPYNIEINFKLTILGHLMDLV